MIWRFAMLALCLIVALGGVNAVHSRFSAQPYHDDRTVWVGHVLERMQTIKPGMTRAELLKVFGTEGGISSPLHRTFVSRDCPYFKVAVEFNNAKASQVDSQGRVTVEDGQDIIVNVSRPYLEFSIGD